MFDDRQNLIELSKKLIDNMKNVTDNKFKIGLGTFVDRPVQPFTSEVPQQLQNPCLVKDQKCEPAYTFRNNLPVSNFTVILVILRSSAPIGKIFFYKPSSKILFSTPLFGIQPNTPINCLFTPLLQF